MQAPFSGLDRRLKCRRIVAVERSMYAKRQAGKIASHFLPRPQCKRSEIDADWLHNSISRKKSAQDREIDQF